MNVFTEASVVVAAQQRQVLDECLSRLQAAKDVWATLSIPQKIELLKRIRQNLADHAEEWVALANAARRIAPHTRWAAEEWYDIFAVASAINGYEETLTCLGRGDQLRPKQMRTRTNGQVVAQAFPLNTFDWLLFNGMSSEVWMQPGVTADNLSEHMGAFYREPHPAGSVALVLGAGNVNSIPPLDVLDQLFVQGQVVLLKLSLVNGYLRPVFEAIFAPLIDAGFLDVVEGDAAVGSYLAYHPDVEAIHITGGIDTYNALMYGSGEEGRGRQQRREMILNKPISSELGGVTPVIVMPGRWTDADIRFQAENIATMKLYNSGFNCIAAQLLILPDRWPQRQQLVDAIQQVVEELPAQYAYYPGVAQRQQAAQLACPEAILLGGNVPRTLIPAVSTSDARSQCFQTEFFGPILAVTTLPGDTAVSFLQNAVTFCNDSVFGTLGVDLIVSPDVQREQGEALETAVAGLRYGAIGVNAWCGIAYRIPSNPWGAFQDPAAADIGSGIGMVHNTQLFDHPQKTVVRGRFRPFPRSWMSGDPAIFPKPPWFVTNRQRLNTAKRVAEFSLNPGYLHLPAIFAAALRG